jgi:hypothetical protein
MNDLDGVQNAAQWADQLSIPATRLRDAVYEHPGPWFDAAVAAAAAGLPEDEAHRVMPAPVAIGDEDL